MDMKPKLIIYDFDGVMTNNKVIVNQDGNESVICNRDDGWGVSRIKIDFQIPQYILSSESNPVIIRRAKKLGISACIGRVVKLQAMRKIIEQYPVNPKEVLYI
jgi:3-deoxy-D-manno-octulosonate 8-phosphate phosphatase (KDO 8-P phosphatase)